MNDKKILVIGGNGQLGLALQDLLPQSPQVIYLTRADLDLSSLADIRPTMEKHAPDVIVNCSAYTAVDKAETDRELAQRINADAVREVVQASNHIGAQLIHVSTDYVFDGTSSVPYAENHQTNPINHYGYTKYLGEQSILKSEGPHMILRTSWLYSMHGQNFLKTILRLLKEREFLNIVDDQIGSPTWAGDLALAIVKIIENNVKPTAPSLYHFSNEGAVSWFDFASAISELAKISKPIYRIKSSEFKTPAQRPSYSVLDKSKIKNDLGLSIPNWRDSLLKVIGQSTHV